MTSRVHHVVDSPIGPLTLVWGGDALRGCWVHDQRERPDDPAFGRYGRSAELDAVAAALAQYFAGERRGFDDVPVEPEGTAFRRAVWGALREIPYGATTSYGALAVAVGRPAATRAVGSANAVNPVSILVPCHRVVNARHLVVGDGPGARRKRRLQAFELGAEALTTDAGTVASSGVRVARITPMKARSPAQTPSGPDPWFLRTGPASRSSGRRSENPGAGVMIAA